MIFFANIRRTGFIAVLALALVGLCTPAEAKDGSAGKKATSTAVKKSKAEKKKKAPKKSKKKSAKPKESKSDSTIVKIKANDPKAFTKAILLDKQGVDYEVVGDNGKGSPKIKPQKKKESGYFDFSTMLVPITHEALIGSPYGIRDHRLHRGVDVNVIKDEPVVAALPGKVIVSKYNTGGYGHYVLLEHENGVQTLYGHLSERLVKVGEYVYPGDVVGLAGNTGKSSAAHLHFEIRHGEVNIDPTTIIDFPNWTLKKGAERFSMKKATADHRKIQNKLAKFNYYVVKKGDSQGDVANWFNISIESLCRINNLKPGAPLKVGQKLHGSKN
ncbi:MAG: peptidoglycan DD-metalloendopeptidase family protein [Fibrobacter sp.]|nr:peptidoglycan DD-metalloendopeptidase family protein [Fibrobacter sp.]